MDHEAEPETEEEKARRLLYCSLCKVAVNSASQLDAHNSGETHREPISRSALLISKLQLMFCLLVFLFGFL